jgi:hypothetical protein
MRVKIRKNAVKIALAVALVLLGLYMQPVFYGEPFHHALNGGFAVNLPWCGAAGVEWDGSAGFFACTE